MAKEGSTISGLMDTLATSISYGLQYGVPLKFFVDKFSHVRFEPSGWTGNQQVPYAKSIVDYLFRWLGARFLGITEPTRGRRFVQASSYGPRPASRSALRWECHQRCPAVLRMRQHYDAQRLLL